MTDPEVGHWKLRHRNRAGVATTVHHCPFCGHIFRDQVLKFVVADRTTHLTAPCPECDEVYTYAPQS